MQKKYTIEKVNDEFIRPVTSLADKLAYSNLSEDERQGGFLLPYSESQYRNFAKHAEYFYILSIDKRLIGFLLAHSSAKIDFFGEEVYLHMKTLQKKPFIVVRQIGIDPEFSKRGYALSLYNFLIKSIGKDTSHDLKIIGFIWKCPPNPASEKFHKALGCKELEIYHLKTGEGAVGIWAYTIKRSANDTAHNRA